MAILPASGRHYRPAARRSAFRRPAAGATDLRVDPHSAGQRPALPTCASIRIPPASGRRYR
ncbi:hypothetical protein JY440_20145, partial [Stenotrophomonas maltophilia]|nr:hypothetical protein [Stenotrophomonas maltophilia]